MAEGEKKRSEHFWKINLAKFVVAIRSSAPEKDKKANKEKEKDEASDELKQLNVLSYILESVHERDNIFVLTYDEVANRTGVSKDTVVRIMNRLGKSNFIRRLHNGAYMVNPYMLMWGPEDKRGSLYLTYKDAKAVGMRRKRNEENEDGPNSSGSQASGKKSKRKPKKKPESSDSQASEKEPEKEPKSSDSRPSDDAPEKGNSPS